MIIDVHARGFSATDAIIEQAGRQVSSALARAGGRVTAVTVRLGDINADHGGDDKLCRVVATVRSVGALVVEAVHRDLYVALSTAAARLARALDHRVGRRRGGRTASLRRPRSGASSIREND